ncbi:MAG: bifunctional riboflavin kinase/FAD synthetase [Syntrophobacterales bacterium]|nr:bifunctional riboflavin kinase/FAD synthetase [Syntrophobacterales bacterium]
MKIIRDLEDIPVEFRGSIVTIGNFDGIHLGHRKIFQKLLKETEKEDRKTIVITFDPHPQKVLHPEKRPFFLLTPLNEKLKLIEKFGIDAVVLITFSVEFAKTTAEEFVRNILWDKLHIQKLYVGYDYVFGRGKEGNAESLKTYGKELGFEVEEIGAVKNGELVVSSTKIRVSILDGDVSLAAKLLGRPYNVYGNVVEGYRRGTAIGYPTANIKAEKVIPGRGVYAIIAGIEGHKYQGVINIGFNPTFGNDELSTEVYLFDFQDNIYGKNIEIFFIDRLRDEMKFENSGKLAEQIKKDVEQAQKILQNHARQTTPR